MVDESDEKYELADKLVWVGFKKEIADTINNFVGPEENDLNEWATYESFCMSRVKYACNFINNNTTRSEILGLLGFDDEYQKILNLPIDKSEDSLFEWLSYRVFIITQSSKSIKKY